MTTKTRTVTTGTTRTTNPQLLSGLASTAAGPGAAQALVTSGATRCRPCLDASGAASIYTINRTPVAKARAALSATASASFLSQVVRSERRISLVTAALEHPLCPLEAVMDAVMGRVRTTGYLPWGLLTRSLHAAVKSHREGHGLGATVVVVLAARGSDWPDHSLCDEVIGKQPGLLDEPAVVQALLEVGAVRSVAIAAERHDVPHAAAWHLISRRVWPVIEVLASNQALMSAEPALAEAILVACEEGSYPTATIVVESVLTALASLPHGAEFLGRVVAIAPVNALGVLAQNPATPVEALAAREVGGWAFQRGAVLGRLLAERVGDDERAYLLAAHLAMGATGTYGDLVNAIAASVA